MKKLLVIALAAIFVFSFAALTMAEATLSGEIDTGYKSTQENADADTISEDIFFGKMTLNGKLGDDLTGCLVFKADNQDGVVVDEADVTFTEGFGTIKTGYYGWNNNFKDIVDNLRGDVKSEFTTSTSLKVAEGFTVGLAYAYKGTDAAGEDKDALYGVDFGYATDVLNVDLLLTNTCAVDTNGDDVADEQKSTTGVQASYKLDAFKVYLQYETASLDTEGVDDPNVTIIGATYDGDALYGRFEYDLTKEDTDEANAMGVRLGYKLADGAKIEFQTKENRAEAKETYLKLICAF